MQKLIIVFMLVGVFLIVGCSVKSIENNKEEQTHSDCPFGKVDYEYPRGDIDTNKNSICNLANNEN